MNGTTALVASRAMPTAMARDEVPTARAIGRGVTASVLAHALVLTAVVVAARGRPRRVEPPVYRVALVSAPVGTSAPSTSDVSSARPAAASPDAAPAHVARPAVAAPPPPRAPASPARAKAAPSVAHPPAVAPRARLVPSAKPAASPVKAPSHPTVSAPKPVGTVEVRARRPAAVSGPRATAAPSAAPARTPAKHAATATGAAARQTPEHAAQHGGGTGAPTASGYDVADVRVVGLAFPYPGYLDNLVRQVRLRFEPTDARAGLHADLAFIVARDGSISGLRVLRSSGNYAFDLEAQGAVEAAGSARAFGPLPDGFHGATLPVTFSFDPRPTP